VPSFCNPLSGGFLSIDTLSLTEEFFYLQRHLLRRQCSFVRFTFFVLRDEIVKILYMYIHFIHLSTLHIYIESFGIGYIYNIQMQIYMSV